MAVQVKLRTVAGAVHQLEFPQATVDVEQLHQQAATALSIPADRFKLVLRGNTITRAAAEEQSSSSMPQRRTVKLSSGDVLLVMPQRKAPSEALQRAAAEAAGVDLPDEDDEPLRFSMRHDAWGWEKALGRFLQDKVNAPELLLVWLFHVGPARLLVLAAVLAGAKVASWYDLGPVYILLAIIITIFTHLGRKKEGEASAYSVFNPGVQRLPGQLDADVIDQQIRRGQI